MEDLVELKRDFLAYLKTERGRSIKTIENYNRYLERFFAYTKIKKVSQLSEAHVLAFRQHLATPARTASAIHSKPMKQRTQNYYLIALRRFLTYVQQQGIAALSPKQIELVRVPQGSLDLLPAEELRRLLGAPDTKTLEGKRDRALLELLFSTGLRVSELCELSIRDITVHQEECTVTGKGGVRRTVFLSEPARQFLEEYLIARTDSSEVLFVRYGRKANDGGDARLHPRAVQRLVKSYAGKVGITHAVTPHVIRHCFATDLLSNGADLRSVQVLLGHTDISTTQMYTRLSDTQLKEVHKKYHER